MRRAHNLDSNHREIVDEFRRLGASVLSLAGLGNGAPDLLVGYAGRDLQVEIKDGRKPPSARALTPAEKRYHAEWMGRPVVIVECREDVLLVLRLLMGSAR